MLKKVAAFLTAVILVALFSGCTTPGGQAEKSDYGLLTDGVLKVGMEIGYPPFELFADDGVTPIGLDVDLANALSEQLGVKLIIEDTAWDGIFSGLDIHKYDCVISAVTINPERLQVMDFSTPYIENWQSITVRKGSPAITSMEGLNGLNVGYQDATTSDEYLEEFIDTGVVDCTTSEYDKVINCFEDLKLGRIDAALADSTVAEGYISRDPDSFEITWHQSNEPGAEAERFGVAVKKDNTKLLNAINEALQALDDSGKLDEILKSWL